ncbi:5-oxoprolinase subunit PxpA [Arenibacter sp. GZD96]|uniref:5-oxoprolinase subunit PxpA n=1 Tax=Aurantibrevibacter litoralis TaxID=3106030 RepID=UPI002AFFECC8|nr:5-oxoprolinase subunit PxpA [Arenibacter sp. GZD-96]MEA1787461.1 5-oxoprolinase subunit PxpA [Arenibacter sp. GZD-96]
MYRSIDINCDVGEGLNNEADLLPYVSSCSIACGGHAGTLETMKHAVQLAKQHHVKIGAHPSYPDPANFGRKSMAISEAELTKSIQEQIENLTVILRAERAELFHIKAHGALYNDLAVDHRLVQLYLNAIAVYKDSTYLYVPYKSLIETEALRNGFRIKREAFADRNYHANLRLVARNVPNALIDNPENVLAHVVRMVNEKEVQTIAGTNVKIEADTYCIHGDTPSALKILMYLSKELRKYKINFRGA